MTFTFTVTVEVERTEGKFATREELAEQILEALESAVPDQLEGENGGQYEVQSFEVVEQERVKPPRSSKPPSKPPVLMCVLDPSHPTHVGPCAAQEEGK